jgi:hypothetical protein
VAHSMLTHQGTSMLTKDHQRLVDGRKNTTTRRHVRHLAAAAAAIAPVTAPKAGGTTQRSPVTSATGPGRPSPSQQGDPNP